ncbi:MULTISPECIES: SDR family NAD(P)-dependent oxidoreductase [unclassified Janthinobacterium]|uniref:SDR family NAD(P)-dependent oxidoreductase n=1 Tax=unclassified Janthinobacterium TaxID=2610881 RepID=UPI00161F71AC|nr:MULTISPECIES: SDR family oxidoreductase [unclassified Janthinobacterium]MBB5609851.1 NAD(P)-dependent dehydrogenase (short-subunit alcohol dehydrogenase family) [Janthinobacterium sp. S3T4]MBB5615117.1 NAD(P)-dependent dehydrogenase (short-subunit alcohol dehydrogenase family) [Janthinobacterium sp. S3M3]
MSQQQKTIIVTGASQGIGAGVVEAFLARGYQVVATSRSISKSAAFVPSERLALVDGDIADMATAATVVQTAIQKFGGIDGLVNNAGIFIAKSFLDYSKDDFAALVRTNLEGYLYISQLVIRQMLVQQRGGSIVGISSTLVEAPNSALTAAVPMFTKGGIEAISRSLASEFAKDGIRVNVVAPGSVDTPLLHGVPQDFLKSLHPMGTISSVADIADAVLYLTEAKQVTGEVLRVDGGAHNGKW